MKATGIVRRIDDLGRVTIPREIRRTMHIKENDPLEIYTDNGGEVIFKKYSPLGQLSDFAAQYAEVLHLTGRHPVMVTDRDHVIAVAGLPKKLLGLRVTSDLESRMEQRTTFVISQPDAYRIKPVEGFEATAFTGAPILEQSQVCGCIMFIGDAIASETDEMLIRTAAVLLGKQMGE